MHLIFFQTRGDTRQRSVQKLFFTSHFPCRGESLFFQRIDLRNSIIQHELPVFDIRPRSTLPFCTRKIPYLFPYSPSFSYYVMSIAIPLPHSSKAATTGTIGFYFATSEILSQCLGNVLFQRSPHKLLRGRLQPTALVKKSMGLSALLSVGCCKITHQHQWRQRRVVQTFLHL